jgi:hypothetical protein
LEFDLAVDCLEDAMTADGGGGRAFHVAERTHKFIKLIGRSVVGWTVVSPDLGGYYYRPAGGGGGGGAAAADAYSADRLQLFHRMDAASRLQMEAFQMFVAEKRDQSLKTFTADFDAFLVTSPVAEEWKAEHRKALQKLRYPIIIDQYFRLVTPQYVTGALSASQALSPLSLLLPAVCVYCIAASVFALCCALPVRVPLCQGR